MIASIQGLLFPKENASMSETKLLVQTEPNPMSDNTQDDIQIIIEPKYPFNFFKHSTQNYRYPVKINDVTTNATTVSYFMFCSLTLKRENLFLKEKTKHTYSRYSMC